MTGHVINACDAMISILQAEKLSESNSFSKVTSPGSGGTEIQPLGLTAALH